MYVSHKCDGYTRKEAARASRRPRLLWVGGGRPCVPPACARWPSERSMDRGLAELCARCGNVMMMQSGKAAARAQDYSLMLQMLRIINHILLPRILTQLDCLAACRE
eukprot:6201184-Pleurochrysis_carterae.AAC.2